MNPVTGLALYLTLWWLVLYTVLPWGVRPEEKPQTGNVTSAPSNPRLRMKFLVTTGISAIIWLVVWFMIQHDFIDFRSIAAAMMQEDKAK